MFGYTFLRLKKRLLYAVGMIADWALFIGIVLIGGLGSSWYMVEAGTQLTTSTVGPWTTWTAAARADADPYTRAHLARAGMLPLSSEFGATYVARTDSDGRSLHSSCLYSIEGRAVPDHWWSLSVFDSGGQLIPNILDRYAFTSDTMTVNADGSFVAALARDARPGNWLPTGGAGQLAVAFNVIDFGTRTVVQDGAVEALLPTIKRESC